MTYTVNNTTLTALVTEEVSRVAAAAYSDDGTSLYDSVSIKSRDADTVSRMIRDGVDAVAARSADICTVIPSPLALSLYAPDMDSTKENMTKDELDRAISLWAVSTWLKEKLPDRSEEYLARANEALEKAVIYLKTRTAPSR